MSVPLYNKLQEIDTRRITALARLTSRTLDALGEDRTMFFQGASQLLIPVTLHDIYLIRDREQLTCDDAKGVLLVPTFLVDEGGKNLDRVMEHVLSNSSTYLTLSNFQTFLSEGRGRINEEETKLLRILDTGQHIRNGIQHSDSFRLVKHRALQNFETILKALKNRQTVRRSSWEADLRVDMVTPFQAFDTLNSRMRKTNPYFIISNGQYEENVWTPSTEDLFANDWEVFVNQPNEPTPEGN